MTFPFRYIPLLAIMLLVSCGDSDTAAHVEDMPPLTRVTEQQCKAFAEKLERTLDSGDANFADNSFDLEAIFKRITAGMSTTDKDMQEFLTIVPAGFGFGGQIIKGKGDGGNIRLLHFRWDDGVPKALYRMTSGDGLLSYYDFYLGERADSQVTIRDVYMYLNGELFTTATRRIVSSDQKNPLYKLLSAKMGEGEGVATTTDSLSNLLNAGLYQDVLNYYNQLPPKPKKEKTAQLLRLMAAQHLGDKEYEEVLEDMNRQFSGDPSMDLMMIDHHFMKHQYDSATATIDRLDRSLGGDPYLNFMRALVDVERNDFAGAREKLHKVIASDSTIMLPYWALVNVSLKEGNNVETARFLTLVERKLGMTFNPDLIATDSTYTAFVQSPEFAAWAAERR